MILSTKLSTNFSINRYIDKCVDIWTPVATLDMNRVRTRVQVTWGESILKTSADALLLWSSTLAFGLVEEGILVLNIRKKINFSWFCSNFLIIWRYNDIWVHLEFICVFYKVHLLDAFYKRDNLCPGTTQSQYGILLFQNQ